MVILLVSLSKVPLSCCWKSIFFIIFSTFFKFNLSFSSSFILDQDNEETKELTDVGRNELYRFVVKPMSSGGLRTICLAYKDLAANEDVNDLNLLLRGLTCIAIFGISDKLRPGASDMAKNCHQAGVALKMVTGESLDMASCVARQCGIISDDDDNDEGMVIDSCSFNQMIRCPVSGKVEPHRFDKVWPRLQVLARAMPEDKFNLVSFMKKSKLNSTVGDVIAVTGDKISDVVCFKASDISFAMGPDCSEVTKDASDVIVTDGNISNLFKTVYWSRTFFDSICKFLQYQMTLNVVACSISLVAILTIEDAVISTVQLLYLNFLMALIASLGFSMEQGDSGIQRPPYGKSRPIVTVTMAKFIIFHSFYQTLVLLFLIFFGEYLFKFESARNGQNLFSPYPVKPTQHYTCVFNTLALMTLFNEFNGRCLHNERNILSNLYKNKIFIVIWIVSIATHILLVLFGGIFFGTASLTIEQWLFCLMFAIVQLFWHQLVVVMTPLEKCRSINRWFGVMAPVDAMPDVPQIKPGVSLTSFISSISPTETFVFYTFEINYVEN